MPEKSNKELAVDVAISYLQTTSAQKTASGESKQLPKIETVSSIIKAVYKTLSELDSK